MKLIIMSCSGTKRADAAPLRAIDRYDGPMWKTLRASLARNAEASAAYDAGDLRIWVLSALYGFIDAATEVPNYDRRMTPEILAKMGRDCSCDFQHIEGMVDQADAVMFAGGSMYRDAMWRASGGHLHHIMKIDETDRGGIGDHRAQLSAWLDTHYQRLAA